MNVRAKFRVTSIADITLGGEPGKHIMLEPVSADAGSDENKIFGKYTPAGRIDMMILGPAASAFEVGRSYYVDFSPAA